MDDTTEISVYDSKVPQKRHPDINEAFICEGCTFTIDGGSEFCDWCKMSNPYHVDDPVQVYDKKLNEWMWGNVVEIDGLYITVRFVGLQQQYDEKIHVQLRLAYKK